MSRRVHALVLLAFVSIEVGAAGAKMHGTRQRCVVPSVRRDKLQAAEKRLRRAHCAVGRIRGSRNGWGRATFHDLLGTKSFPDMILTPGWHTFASDWEPGSITYYWDGVEFATDPTGITSAPMYIVLDNSGHSDWASDTEADSLQIQHVRVWQH